MGDKINIVVSVVKAGAAAIPVAGGPISSIIGDIQSHYAEERQKEFFNQFKVEMENRLENIKDSTVQTEDFSTFFINTYNDILKTREEQKRRTLRHILVNSSTKALSELDFDRVEKIERLVCEMPVKELMFLMKLHEKFSNQEFSETEVVTKCNLLGKDCGINNGDDLLEVIKDLEVENLINALYDQYTTAAGNAEDGSFLSGGSFHTAPNGYITSIGLELIDLIC